MTNFLKKFIHIWPYLIILGITVWTFWPFFFQGKIPVAGDILLGQYYPWLDQKWDNYSTIFPVLNSTIPDSIFSFYPWKLKAIESIKNGYLPIYDPSTYMGHQLFATGTTGIFYPLNIFFLLLSFNLGWGLLVALTTFLSSVFFYFWLRNKELEKMPSLIVSIAYSFSAFIALQISFINTAHSVLWLPLVLLAIDKLLVKIEIKFFLLIIFALFSSLNAGFFQGSLYITSTAFLYAFFFGITQKKFKSLCWITLGFIFPVLLSSFQILPFMEVTAGSNRLSNYGATGKTSEIFEFFVPYEFLITTFFPDFFGNPGKANYFGGAEAQAWVGYFEFNNFVGSLTVLGFFIGLFLVKKQKTVLFFLLLFLVSLILATPNPTGTLPYNLSLPVISSLVPSRLLLVTQFSLLVIAAFGLNTIYKRRLGLKHLAIASTPLFMFYTTIILLSYLHKSAVLDYFGDDISKWSVTFRNTILPAVYLFTFSVLLLLYLKFRIRLVWIVLLIISCFELIKQTSYFRPFIKPELIYPKTSTIDFLEQNLNGYRMMINKQDLIPTNSQLVYKLKIVDGEGPIYPKDHGAFIASINAGNIGEELPSFRRMVYFRNNGTNLLGLLNVKYLVTSNFFDNPNFKLVHQEGSTKVYQNLKMLDRAWSVKSGIYEQNKIQTLRNMLSPEFDFQNTALVADPKNATDYAKSEIRNFNQKNNLISFSSKSEGESLIVLSEQYYPGWRAFIGDKEIEVIKTNFNLLGLKIPAGDNKVDLVYEMQSFIIGSYISFGALGILIILSLLLRFKFRNQV